MLTKFPQATERAALLGEVVRRCRNRHQAAQTESGQYGNRLRQGRHRRRRDSRLARLATDVHLQTDRQLGHGRRTLRGEPLGDSQFIDRVHPVEGFCHQTRLVGLQHADEMPFDPQVAQFVDLADGFLHVALAESLLAGGGQLAQCRRRPGLAHGEQANVGRVATVQSRGVGDSRAYGLQLGRKCGHNRASRRLIAV
ncbi:MAG: hypothetical protein AW07_01134 [Candidatus Accumulibacter sp. SK-11]|nr:MAG: hypothetical protein AW07_01134 [Candidatus Accumulibacter sp. SK-11]